MNGSAWTAADSTNDRRVFELDSKSRGHRPAVRRAPTLRLFLALWPPPAALAALAAQQRAWTWPAGAAPVATERLHMTLHFLGAVDAARLDTVRSGLAVPFEPFVLPLAQAQARVWHGGLAVLEMEAPDALLRLHGQLGSALRALGLPVDERAFRPHVTLARKAGGARPAPTSFTEDWTAQDGYALVCSVPGRGYDTLQTYGPA